MIRARVRGRCVIKMAASAVVGKPVMKFYKKTTCFSCAWDTMFQAISKRYPNPHSSHVLSEDIIDRYTNDGKLYSKKLFSKTSSIKPPRWGEWILGGASTAFIVEESVVDPSLKTFTTYSRNLTLTRLSLVEEKCEYFMSPDDPSMTCVTKSAWFKSSITGLSRPIEHFIKERYQKNTERAEKGLQYVIDKLISPHYRSKS